MSWQMSSARWKELFTGAPDFSKADLELLKTKPKRKLIAGCVWLAIAQMSLNAR